MQYFCCDCYLFVFFFFKQKTAYEMRISDWSSDVCSSDLYTAMVRGDRRSETENASMPLKPAAFLAACLVLFTPLTAIAQDSPAQNSTPATLPVTDTLPVAQDIPYPGTMLLMVAAPDTVQNILKVRQLIPIHTPAPHTLH